MPPAIYNYRLLVDEIIDKHIVIDNFILFTIPTILSSPGRPPWVLTLDDPFHVWEEAGEMWWLEWLLMKDGVMEYIR